MKDWRQRGAFRLWRYLHSSQHRYNGLYLGGDAAAARSLADLLECLSEGRSGTCSVRLERPRRSALSVPGFDSDFEWFRKMDLVYERARHGIAFAITGESLVLTIGYTGARALRETLERYGRGDCDFALPCEVSGGGKYDRALWFWCAS